MGKRLVEAANLDTAICPATGTVYADGTILLTPGAKDELARRGIPVVYGPGPAASACAPAPCAECPGQGLEPLLRTVAGILQEHFGITDPEQLKSMSRQVVDVVRNNI